MGLAAYDDIPGATVFDAERIDPLVANLQAATRISRVEHMREVRRFYHVPASNTAVGHMILECEASK